MSCFTCRKNWYLRRAKKHHFYRTQEHTVCPPLIVLRDIFCRYGLMTCDTYVMQVKQKKARKKAKMTKGWKGKRRSLRRGQPLWLVSPRTSVLPSLPSRFLSSCKVIVKGFLNLLFLFFSFALYHSLQPFSLFLDVAIRLSRAPTYPFARRFLSASSPLFFSSLFPHFLPANLSVASFFARPTDSFSFFQPNEIFLFRFYVLSRKPFNFLRKSSTEHLEFSWNIQI